MPNRIIKESICRSDTINSLKPFEEILFYRLIVVCDDYGRFDGRPSVIKGYCFPLKDTAVADIKAALDKLVETGLVELYEVQGKPVLQLSTWSRHQQIRAKKSKYPSPDEAQEIMTDDTYRNKKISSENNGNQLISSDSNSPRNRESIYENRESYSRNGDARAIDKLCHFEEFLSAYPKGCNRHLTETAYIDLLRTGNVTEDVLVQCSKNYAEACKILETEDRYIKNAENFLRDMVFEQYLPEKYKKPEPKRPKNSFHDFQQNQYDYDDLLQKVKRN